MSWLRTTFLLISLSSTGLLPAQTPPPQTSSGQSVKSDVNAVGRHTKHATKKTAYKAKKGTRNAVHKGAKETKQGSQRVENKTRPPQP